MERVFVYIGNTRLIMHGYCPHVVLQQVIIIYHICLIYVVLTFAYIKMLHSYLSLQNAKTNQNTARGGR